MLESIINIAVGFGISLAAQIFILPLLGVAISLRQNLAFALIMTVISIARSFALRRIFEALHIRVPLSPALMAIASERRRQIDVEGWDAAHDDLQNEPGDLAAAAAAYAMATTYRARLSFVELPAAAPCPNIWPWLHSWWKPQDDRRDLVRSGALVVAALDQLNRSRKSRKTV